LRIREQDGKAMINCRAGFTRAIKLGAVSLQTVLSRHPPTIEIWRVQNISVCVFYS
jgi:hypothetical protein